MNVIYTQEVKGGKNAMSQEGDVVINALTQGVRVGINTMYPRGRSVGQCVVFRGKGGKKCDVKVGINAMYLGGKGGNKCDVPKG